MSVVVARFVTCWVVERKGRVENVFVVTVWLGGLASLVTVNQKRAAREKV